MSGEFVLFRITVEKSFALMRRYLFNTALMVSGLYLVFAAIFFGGRTVAPNEVNSSIEGIVVGYFLFTMAIRAFQKTSMDLNREAQWGTLEQLYLSPHGIGKVMAANSVVNVLGSFAVGSLILVLMVVTTGTDFQVRLLTVGVVGALTLSAPIGIGFVAGGLALIYKRVGQAANLLQFGLLGFIALPVDAHPVAKYLPMTLGSHMLQQSMNEGIRLWEFSMEFLAVLLVTSAVYLLAGYLVFQWLQRIARVRGVLGHY